MDTIFPQFRLTTVYNLSQFGIKITTSPSYKINPDHVIVHVEKY
jgi:hypothetical protein